VSNRDDLNNAVDKLLTNARLKRAAWELEHATGRVQRDSPGIPIKHVIRQEGDERVCSCGVRWDVKDPEPPEGH
jgi:hypothetical protein